MSVCVCDMVGCYFFELCNELSLHPHPSLAAALVVAGCSTGSLNTYSDTHSGSNSDIAAIYTS